VVLCGGRLVERSEHGLHNTAVLFDRDGRRLATYRKVHLLPYGSREAGLLEPGNEPVTAACEGTTIGLATCFDLRLAELFRMLIDDGAELFVVVSDDASVPLGGRDKRPQYAWQRHSAVAMQGNVPVSPLLTEPAWQ
jgi:predicted amidohydrolase